MDLGEWLDRLDRLDGAPETDPPGEPSAAALRGELETVAVPVAERLEGAGFDLVAAPIVVGKYLALAVGSCEGRALAGLTPSPVSTAVEWPLVRGRALDAFVAHVLSAGPVADPVHDLDSILRVRGDHDGADAVGELLDDDRTAELAELAAAAGRLRIPADWAARTEVPLGSWLAGGRVELPARLDVLLGGPGTGRPAAVLEVKSGAPDPGRHAAELHHYALACLLRHGRAPAAMALWYPDGTLVDVHVRGAAAAAARRLCDVLEALAELAAGRPPELRPGGHCRWCELAERCAAAAPEVIDVSVAAAGAQR